MSNPAFTVLLVCTANHCRSPLAEHLLRSRPAVRGLGWRVESAGTRCQPGVPMHPLAAELLGQRGLDVAGWVSQPVTESLIRRADLVLTAAEEHRGAVVQRIPQVLARTFTLLQFAHLLRSSAPSTPEAATGGGRPTPDDVGRHLVGAARHARGQVQPMSKAERDLADPNGYPAARFRRCAATIDQALDDILAWRGSAGGVDLPTPTNFRA